MKRVLNYMGYAVRSVMSNKLYAVFYILGTTVAFILIIILLAAVRLISGDTRPFVNSEHSIQVNPDFTNSRGNG